MNFFSFEKTFTLEARFSSLNWFKDSKKRVLKLQKRVKNFKFYAREEEMKLKSQMKNEQRILDELNETYKDLKEDLAKLNEEQQTLTDEVTFVKDELFWKGIHKKHVREDLTDFKVTINILFCFCVALIFTRY